MNTTERICRFCDGRGIIPVEFDDSTGKGWQAETCHHCEGLGKFLEVTES